MPKHRISSPVKNDNELYRLIIDNATIRTTVPTHLRTRVYNGMMRHGISTKEQVKEILPQMLSGEVKFNKIGKNSIRLLQEITK